MEVIVSARHFEVGDDLRSYAETKVTELALEHPKLTTARVVLEVQRNWHLAEVHVNGKHLDMVATAQTESMYASIDAATEKLEKQLRKHLEKIQDHRVKEDTKLAHAEAKAEIEVVEEEDEPEVVKET